LRPCHFGTAARGYLLLCLICIGENRNLFNNECDASYGIAASGLKVRYGPFVSFKSIFKFSKWIFKDYKIFENSKNYESYENYKIYEGSCIV